ncbi:MAG: hypothetical protein GX344_00955 [Intrasporangiaceae bacterium]|nr:hypothetical protein [Intrasporangiaceae bacterium]
MSTNETSVPRKSRPKKILAASASYEIRRLRRDEATVTRPASRTWVGIPRPGVVAALVAAP